MASKVAVLCAAALCFVAGIEALKLPVEAGSPSITVDTEITTTVTASTATITTSSDTTSSNAILTVTTTETAPSTTTQLPSWSAMESSQIMSAYSSIASSINDECMASVSSLMTSAQDRNNQYYYYANWYISSNEARTGSATRASVVTVTV